MTAPSSRLAPLTHLGLATGLLLAVAAEPTVCHATDDGSEIVATATHLRNETGVVRIALYARRDGWLEHGRELASCVAVVQDAEASCSLGHHRPGRYAIALLHDEDANGDMNRDFFGLPQEGYGFSNDARPGLGPPSFDDAAFRHGEDTSSTTIRARYGI